MAVDGYSENGACISDEFYGDVSDCGGNGNCMTYCVICYDDGSGTVDIC
jgi:hypothetical protein